MLGFIKQGLRDFSMSRTSISWGIPLPWDPKHVAYVWFDALFNYCTAVGLRRRPRRFDRYWPVDYHLVGKDILRFHAVYWPAMLMAAGLDAAEVRVRARLAARRRREDERRRALNQIAPADLVADFGVDGFRYHFIADQRFGPDGDFSYEAMVARYNADLANNFGNLANRVLNMAVNYCGGVVPEPRADGPLVDAAGERVRRRCRRRWRGSTSPAASARCGSSSARRTRTSRTAQPWALHKAGDADAVAGVLGDCLEALRIVALLASPVIPNAAAELWRRLGLPGRPEDAAPARRRRAGASSSRGARLEKGAPLFPRKDVE